MMDPLIQVSPRAGELVEVMVPGTMAFAPNPENEVDAVAGAERSMFAYAPASGCPHPKQTQVLMVLRDSASAQSAQEALEELGIAELAEREHAIVVFPNPLATGWNYGACEGRDDCDDDCAFLVRCFAALKGALGVSGFNGMMFYLGTDAASSAMAWTLACTRPLDAAAVMVGAFPADYVPAPLAAEQVAWVYGGNEAAAEALARANGADGAVNADEVGRITHAQAANPCVRYTVSAADLSANELRAAWDGMFSGARRWRNSAHGTYQPRIDFEARGFVPHVADTCLDLPDGLPRTWYEYVPARLRGTDEPVPLVLYFHGINCCGLYGAEQSGWADLADRDGFAVVFPDATVEMRWNAWDDPRIPSDVAFVRALIEHMNAVHPIDRSRIYISGFSMGSMFSNALACSYPELFAGVVACNGPHMSYFSNLDESVPGMLAMNPASALRDLPEGPGGASPTRELADRKQRERPCVMPFVQFVGLKDGVGFERGRCFPASSDADGTWGPTVAYWKAFDGIPVEPLYDGAGAGSCAAQGETGFASDVVEILGADERFVHQSWTAADGTPGLYHLVGVRDMPHAVDLRAIEIGWNIVKRYRRAADGSLQTVAEGE